MVTAQSIRKQKEELRNYLRNSDIIDITTRGVSTVTKEFDGDTIETEFILTNTGVKNIRSIKVDTVTLTYGLDYNISEDNTGVSTVTFTTAPATGIDNIEIIYDYGASDKIFDDYPQDYLTIETFPRIGFDIINSKTKEIAFSGKAFQSNKTVQVNVYSKSKKQIEEYIDTIRQLIINTGDDLYYWNFLEIDNFGPLLPVDVKGGKIFQRNIDLRAEFEFEC